ncbi:fungal-specific transcription factor domain-containing protein [Bisporella sp. PMI_857]|nr:fungal-specific transcription factor domain-containing protein [Bisporella sp. PMI_857]
MDAPFAASSEPFASPPTDPAPTPRAKEFACGFPGCTKSFTRAEHLHRHALNHNEGNGTACHRCSAVFKRRDLLERHMARHKEKDDEAGGEGLGKLLTRKRLWRDSTGAIVSKKRPEHEKERKQPAMSRNDPSLVFPRQSVGSAHTNSRSPPNELPLSPRSLDPASNGSELTEPPIPDVGVGSEKGQGSTAMDSPWPVPARSLPFPDNTLPSFDFLCNGSWPTQPSRANVGPDLPFYDAFAPDSVNPSDTRNSDVSYYSWLFGNDPWEPWPPTAADINGYHNRPPLYSSNTTLRHSPHGLTSSPMGFNKYPDTRLPPISQEVLGSGVRNGSPQTTLSNGVPAFAEFLAMSHNPELNSNRYPKEASSGSPLGAPIPVRGLGISSRSDQFILTPPESRTGPDLYRNSQPLKRPRRLPVIGEISREGVLRFVDNAHPKSQDGAEITRNDPSLSTATLQHFSDLFFRRFNTSYPLFHQPTFDPAHVDPLLLVAILQLGATYSTKDDHIFAIALHNTMRAQIFGHPSFTSRPPTWMLQTIMLVECFGKLRAGQLQHDMSHVFHEVLINLVRKSDCQFARCEQLVESHDLDFRWRREVDAEQRRRLALFCFMWDTQNAVLLSQGLCMSTKELNLTLPWDPLLWEADTAEYWQSIKSTQRPLLSFHSTLKAYVNPDLGQRPQLLNGLSRILILHGLISVACYLSRNNQTLPGPSITNWQSRISNAYEAWRADFETFTKDTLTSLTDHQHAKDDFQKFSTANIALYHAAHIILHVSLTDLQIYAGATHILGRAILPGHRAHSKRTIEKWAGSNSLPAANAISHAALILRDGVRKLHNWDAGDVFHYNWLLYIAALTCWAFQTVGNEGGKPRDSTENGNDEDDWDARAEMNALISAITRAREEELWHVARKYRTADLPRVIAKHLSSVRWAVVQEGVVVLRGLST